MSDQTSQTAIDPSQTAIDPSIDLPLTPEDRRARWRAQYAANPEAARCRSRRSYDKHKETLLAARRAKREAQRLIEGRPKHARTTPLLPRYHETNSSSPENDATSPET